MTDQSERRSASIQRRAEDLAAGRGADDLVGAADVLAGVHDGSLAFDDLDDRQSTAQDVEGGCAQSNSGCRDWVKAID